MLEEQNLSGLIASQLQPLYLCTTLSSQKPRNAGEMLEQHSKGLQIRNLDFIRQQRYVYTFPNTCSPNLAAQYTKMFLMLGKKTAVSPRLCLSLVILATVKPRRETVPCLQILDKIWVQSCSGCLLTLGPGQSLGSSFQAYICPPRLQTYCSGKIKSPVPGP